MNNETENQIYLRRAKETLAAAREAESNARRALAQAVEQTQKAKEKYERLFEAEEQAEMKRRKTDYRHCTL